MGCDWIMGDQMPIYGGELGRGNGGMLARHLLIVQQQRYLAALGGIRLHRHNGRVSVRESGSEAYGTKT